jgi:hypothetical protein
MIRRVEDEDGREHVEASPTEARQARKGWPILYVLLAGTFGAFLALVLIFVYFA